MPNAAQLPHVLKLLDDESSVVRHAVEAELLSYGSNLDSELNRLDAPPSARDLNMIRNILVTARGRELKERWPDLLHLEDDDLRLELCLTVLSDFVSGHTCQDTLPALLDDLAARYRDRYGSGDAVQLARFLFTDTGLAGERDDYYNPVNSSLVHTIKKKRGLPISLSCIYILVGWRLDVLVRGINLPGHFITQAISDQGLILVDCFNQGRILEEEDILKTIPGEILESLTVDSSVIIRRVLNNLANAYDLVNDEISRSLVLELLEMCEAEEKEFF
jgi:hypothetical protein